MKSYSKAMKVSLSVSLAAGLYLGYISNSPAQTYWKNGDEIIVGLKALVIKLYETVKQFNWSTFPEQLAATAAEREMYGPDPSQFYVDGKCHRYDPSSFVQEAQIREFQIQESRLEGLYLLEEYQRKAESENADVFRAKYALGEYESIFRSHPEIENYRPKFEAWLKSMEFYHILNEHDPLLRVTLPPKHVKEIVDRIPAESYGDKVRLLNEFSKVLVSETERRVTEERLRADVTDRIFRISDITISEDKERRERELKEKGK